MWEDPIVAEVRKVREELLARYHGDLAAMVRAVQAEAIADGRTFVEFPPRPVQPPAQPARPKYDVEEMPAGNTEENRHPEQDMGPPVGKEIC